MAKNKEQGESFITKWTEGQKYVINDTEHQSKAFVPIYIDAGNSVEIVQIDGGLITGLPKGEVICDNLVYTIKDSSMGLNITWIIELKGTKNPKEARHSIKQIISSIHYFQDQMAYPKAFKYVNNRDYVFAAIAGAPDKTIVKYGISQLLKAGLSDSVIKKMTGASEKVIQGCLLHEDNELRQIINTKMLMADQYYEF